MKKGQQKIIWFAFESAIGIGKSTLCTALERRFNADNRIVFCQEPVELWEKNGVLKKSYEDPVVFSFPTQCIFFASRIEVIVKAIEDNKDKPVLILISERSPFSDTLFWNTKKNNGSVDPILHEAYTKMWSHFQKLLPENAKQPSLFIYLKTSLETSMKRLRSRGRDAETSVTDSYQQLLIDQHEEHFVDGQNTRMPDGKEVPCIVLDAEGNFRDDAEEFEKIASVIRDKLEEF